MWKEFRKKVFGEARRVVVKVGSAVLAGESGLDLRVVNRLADQLAALHDRGLDVVLVSSGAVAAGCRVMDSCMVRKGLAYKQATSAIGQSRLMHAYDEAFERYDKVTAQVLLTRDDLKSRERFLNARQTLSQLLAWRVIPIINENDTVAVQELKFGDNDALGALVLNLIEADLFINLTSADGVFDDNPLENPNASFLECIEDIGALNVAGICKGKTGQGTGGMYSKLLAARRAAQIGVPTLIVSGRIKFALEKVFSGEELGTWVMPDTKTISRRKFWLAYNLDPSGELVVDDGAARALGVGGRSLLPAGILEVRGNFGVGALVRVVGQDNESLGVGLSSYKAADLRKIMGHSSGDIEQILGQCIYEEAVHRDNFLLDAAI
jgi:glutamate 5-kinase